MFKRIGIGCCLILCAAGSLNAYAQQRVVSLDEVSRLALDNNFDIQLVKYDIRISRQGIDAAKSAYDTLLEASLGYGNDKSAHNSTLLSDETTSRDAAVSLARTLPSGTTVTVEHAASRTRQDPATSVTYNPVHEASVGVTVSQDLGRNFFGLQDRGAVRVAMKDVAGAEYVSFDKIEQALADVQKSYWVLVLNEEIYTMQQEFLDQSKRLYEIDQERITHGLIEEPQLLGSEANYQQQWSAVLAARDELKASENVLRLELNLSRDRDAGLAPAERFHPQEPVLSLDDSLAKALANRRDYQAAMNEISRRDILLVMKKNLLWPQINLEASWAQNGLDDSYGGAIAAVFHEDHTDLSAELSVSGSLENRAARSEMTQAQFARARALLELKYLERRIMIEIVDSIRRCDIAYQRYESLNTAADLQTRKARAQEEIFRRGRSDSDTVIRYQEDAIAARLQAAQAAYAYYTAMIDLQRSEGALLPRYWDGQI